MCMCHIYIYIYIWFDYNVTNYDSNVLFKQEMSSRENEKKTLPFKLILALHPSGEILV